LKEKNRISITAKKFMLKRKKAAVAGRQSEESLRRWGALFFNA
jgi:hypothetical protein